MVAARTTAAFRPAAIAAFRAGTRVRRRNLDWPASCSESGAFLFLTEMTTMNHRNFATSFILGSLLLAPGCGGSGEGEPCSVADHTGCEKGMVCEEVAGATSACFAPVAF